MGKPPSNYLSSQLPPPAGNPLLVHAPSSAQPARKKTSLPMRSHEPPSRRRRRQFSPASVTAQPSLTSPPLQLARREKNTFIPYSCDTRFLARWPPLLLARSVPRWLSSGSSAGARLWEKPSCHRWEKFVPTHPS